MSWVIAGVAAFEVVSGVMQADTIREGGKIQKAIDEMNAQFAEVDAYHAEQDGYTKVARYQSEIDKTIGAQKVGLAAQDVDISFGSAAEVQADTKLTGFLNSIDIRNQAHAVANGYRDQARNLRLHGSQAASQADLNASATTSAAVLGGAKTLASGYTKPAKKGAATPATSSNPGEP